MVSRNREIKFKENLNNKLNCDIFTTIRPYDQKKYKRGRKYGIVEMHEGAERMRGEAIIIDVEPVWASDLSDRTSLLDSCMCRADLLAYLDDCFPDPPVSRRLLCIVTLAYVQECDFCGNIPAKNKIGNLKACFDCYYDYPETNIGVKKMTRTEWLNLVQCSNRGLYKPGTLGREVYEGEIEAALEAQRIYANTVNVDRLVMNAMDFHDVEEGSTFRDITEPIHKPIRTQPLPGESCWVNVWHSVAEAAYLTGKSKWMNAQTGAKSCYLAYCRECRDWDPSPPMFYELSVLQQVAWSLVCKLARKMMKETLEGER